MIINEFPFLHIFVYLEFKYGKFIKRLMYDKKLIKMKNKSY
jgi:hypothetical protein